MDSCCISLKTPMQSIVEVNCPFCSVAQWDDFAIRLQVCCALQSTIHCQVRVMNHWNIDDHIVYISCQYVDNLGHHESHYKLWCSMAAKFAKRFAVGLSWQISLSGQLEVPSAGFLVPARFCLTCCIYVRSLSPLVNSSPGAFGTFWLFNWLRYLMVHHSSTLDMVIVSRKHLNSDLVIPLFWMSSLFQWVVYLNSAANIILQIVVLGRGRN